MSTTNSSQTIGTKNDLSLKQFVNSIALKFSSIFQGSKKTLPKQTTRIAVTKDVELSAAAALDALNNNISPESTANNSISSGLGW